MRPYSSCWLLSRCMVHRSVPDAFENQLGMVTKTLYMSGWLLSRCVLCKSGVTKTLYMSGWLLSRCVLCKSGEPFKFYKHALWMTHLTLNLHELWFRFWFKWNHLPKPSSVVNFCCTCRTGFISRVLESLAKLNHSSSGYIFKLLYYYYIRPDPKT